MERHGRRGAWDVREGDRRVGACEGVDSAAWG